MRETIVEIRELLSRLECEADQSETTANFRALSGLELPDMICDVIDFLLPVLTPYEAVLYMYLFRHSIIETGSPYVRASTRKLQSGVFKARSNSPDAKAALGAIRATLAQLANIGAIRQEGDANRDGTLYRLLLPEEIEVCAKHRSETATNSPIAATEEEADFYNVRENRLKIYERDNYTCRHCGKQLTRITATLDHVHPVAEGGGNSADNLVTACLSCNSRKNSRPLGDFMAEQR
jgi:hypothetical protein